MIAAEGILTMAAGRTSRRNVAAAPEVALCWPGDGTGYCLLVDGTAVTDDIAETVTVTPTHAILHRLAGAPAELPACVPVERAADVTD